MRKTLIAVLVAILTGCPLACFADASYEHTTQVTGGQFTGVLQHMMPLAKNGQSSLDPASETTMVSGNRKAIVSKNYTEIWDLDKQEVIHIDNQRRSYTVMTFDEMRKMMEQMQERMAEMQQKMHPGQSAASANLQTSYTVHVENTGQTKMVGNYTASQRILTLTATVSDAINPGSETNYTVTDEMWVTPEIPVEMREVRNFDRRFGAALTQGMDMKDLIGNLEQMRTGSQMAMTQLTGSHSGLSDAMTRFAEEIAKIPGTRLIETIRIGGSGTGMNAQPAAESGANQPGFGNHLGGAALGSALGGLLNRKKQQQQPPAAQQPDPAAPANGVTLMEETFTYGNFSAASVSPSTFEIPSGYKQAPSPFAKMAQ
jgi:hypothetical protein